MHENLYGRYTNEDGSYAWQKANQDSDEACGLVIPATSSDAAVPVPVVVQEPQPSDESFTVIGGEAQDSETAEPLPDIEVNNTLLPLLISEIMPNPIGTGNDTSDEYVELYNPNSATFDLSGYKLRSGLSTLRYYTFPPGSSIAGGGYRVLSAEVTELSLSNTTGQVAVLKPDGSVLALTDVYKYAKDGMAWQLFSGAWQWSTSPTPGIANIAALAQAPKKSSSATTGSKKTVKSAAAKTSKKVKAKAEKKPKTVKPTKLTTTPTAATVESKPIQFRVIAIIALIALLYGAYEYRGDLANKFQQCRRHVSSWRPRRRSARGG